MLIKLPDFISVDILDNIYYDTIATMQKERTLTIDFDGVKSINIISFNHLIKLIKTVKLLGYHVIICSIPPHLSIVMCEWDINELDIGQNCNEHT